MDFLGITTKLESEVPGGMQKIDESVIEVPSMSEYVAVRFPILLCNNRSLAAFVNPLFYQFRFR